MNAEITLKSEGRLHHSDVGSSFQVGGSAAEKKHFWTIPLITEDWILITLRRYVRDLLEFRMDP